MVSKRQKKETSLSLTEMERRGHSSTSLLQGVLNAPNLPAVIRSMQPFALVKLVQHVGVEDCAEILEHVSPPQLATVLDEDLWRAKRMGEPEAFDPAQAVRWMRVWREIGPEHVVATLEGQGREFVATLVIHFADVQELSGVAWDMLNLDGFGSILENQDQPFRHLYGEYFLDARIRDEDLWELFESTLDALSENCPDFLATSLALCCNRSHQDEWDDEGRGRERVFEIEEILRDNLAKDREYRRRRFGFLDPEQARDMLQACRLLCPPKAVRSFLSERFLWTHNKEDRDVEDEATSSTGEPASSPTDEETKAQDREAARALEGILFSLDAPEPLRLALSEGEQQERPIHAALRIAAEGGCSEVELQGELAGLANLLYSGCNLIGKRMNQRVAFDAVLATTELGLANAGRQGLPQGGLIGAFQVGLSRLHKDVVLETAAAFDDLVRSRHPDHTFLHETWVKASLNREPNRRRFYILARDGRFLDLYRYLVSLKAALPPTLSYPLRCLMCEYPVLPQALGKNDFVSKHNREWRFFSMPEDFDSVRSFLKIFPELV